MNKEQILKAFSEFCNTHFGDVESTAETVESETSIVKSLDEEERRALFIVLEPQNADGTTEDLHGDWYSELDVEEACNNFNTACRKAGLMHKVVLDEDSAVILQSFTSLNSFTMDNGTFVKKGTWLQWWHIPDDELWASIKSGEIDSVSIDCVANAYEM